MQLPIINKLSGTERQDLLADLIARIIEYACYAVIFGGIAFGWIATSKDRTDDERDISSGHSLHNSAMEARGRVPFR